MKLKHSVTVPRPDPASTGFYGTVELPAGLRVVAMTCPSVPSGKVYYIDEFPSDLFPAGSIELHDAQHYGVAIPAEAVTE